MCTIGSAITNQGNIIFKNRDPRRGTQTNDWVNRWHINGINILVIQNDIGCYGGLNQFGIGVVGTFVNISSDQNNYFDQYNLLDILKQGEESNVVGYLKKNDAKLYGNILMSTPNKIIAFELAGKRIFYEIVHKYVMTNHFKKLPLTLRTIDDELIKNWTTKRLERGEQIIYNVNSIEDAKQFLSDHKNEIDYSICNHGQISTASSYIINSTKKQVHYCLGKPCCNDFVIYNM